MKPSKFKKKILKKINKKIRPKPAKQDPWDMKFSGPERPLASRLAVETTYKCAARCPHCYLLQQNSGIFKNQTDMDSTLFQRLMDSPFTRSLKSIVFTGGEALLNPRVFDWMDQAEKRGISEIGLLSNGLSLQIDEIVSRVLEKKNISHFNISLDSTTEEGYCRSKGIKNSNFEKICEQISKIADRFHDTQTKIYGSFVRKRFNAEDTHRIVTFAQSIGLHNVKLTAFHKAKDVYLDQVESQGYEKFQSVIDQITAKTDYQIDIIVQLPPAFARKRFFCHSLANYLCVSPDGTLSPCCHIPGDEKYGHFNGATENPINHSAIAIMRNQFMKAAASRDLRLLPEQCRLCNKRTPKNVLVFKTKTQKWQKIYRPKE